MAKTNASDNVPLSRFGVLVAQLESIVASASQKSPDPLLCFEILSDLISAIDEEPKVFPPTSVNRNFRLIVLIFVRFALNLKYCSLVSSFLHLKIRIISNIDLRSTSSLLSFIRPLLCSLIYTDLWISKMFHLFFIVLSS